MSAPPSGPLGATWQVLKKQQDDKEDLLRHIDLFETFSDDQIAALASTLQPVEYEDRARIIVQGEEGQVRGPSPSHYPWQLEGAP